MSMGNTWGAGGLFEQALRNKLDNNSMKSETERMNALTQRSDMFNRYDIGLRGNEVNRMNADVNRMNAGANVMNAQTNQYGAETQRFDVAGGMSKNFKPSQGFLQSAGLRSFQPFQSAAGGPAQPLLATGTMSPEAASSLAPISAADAERALVQQSNTPAPRVKTNTTASGNKYYGDREMKPGYAKGGPIGDVGQDRGADTVDAKVRPGEYMLNPETVAHLGGGNYENGVRQLNQLVRQATGKEPGPSPVGKSGKPGFNKGGFIDDFGNTTLRPDAPRAVWEQAASPEGRATIQNQFAAPQTAAREAAARAAQQASAVNQEVAARATQARAINPTVMPPAATPEPIPPRGYAAGKAIGQGVRAAKEALPAIARSAGESLAPAAATLEAGYNMYDKGDFYNDESVPSVEKFKQSLRDMSGPVGAWAGGTVGAGAGVGLASIPLGIGGGLAGHKLMTSLVDGEGDAYKAYRAANPRPEKELPKVAEKEEPKDAPVVADEAVSATGTPQAAPEFDLRKFVTDRLQENATNDTGYGSKTVARENDVLLNMLGNYENASMNRKGTMAQLAQQRAEKNDDRIANNMFTKQELDKDGEPTGRDIPDKAKAVAFQRDMAQLGHDTAQMDPKTLNYLAREWEAVHALRTNLNREATEAGGANARTSNTARAVQMDPDGVGLASAFKHKGVSTGDVLSSWNPFNDKITNATAYDPATGQTIAAARLARNEDGSLNQDIINAMRQGDVGLRDFYAKVGAAAKAAKKPQE